MRSMLMTTEYAPAEDRHELQQLLLHIAGGERDALAELYQRTRTAVYGLALSYLKNAQDAQDLTQDVYVQVWDCAAQYRPSGSPMGWLLTVCRSLCLMRLRREERRTALSDEEWDAIPAQECGLDAEELIPVLSAMQSSLGVGMEQTKTVFITVFLFAHGYASMIANNELKYDEDTINSHLERAYRGAILAAQEEMA